MHNREPLDLSLENEGVRQVNYLTITKFFNQVTDHVEVFEPPRFRGLITYGTCLSNKFGNYNIDIAPICWLLFARDDNTHYPIPLELKGRVMLQVTKQNCLETPKQNSIIEVQIYNDDIEYNPETKYKKYVCTSELTKFVKDHIEATKNRDKENSQPRRLFDNDSIRLD